MRKTWQEKMADKENFPKILKLEKRFPCYNAVHKMGANEGDDVVLVNPSEIIPFMKRVPKGKLITITQICQKIARKHNVKGCCSLTTGIFIMTIANAVEEMNEGGKDLRIPYWRTLKADGELNEKYPGGALMQRRLLTKEGFAVVKKGKKYFVRNFQDNLAR
ncbi:MAG TPA: MGMT family protein [Bacteroidota bacterium]|nr:MGMT family protein [Bacteroidota bacterium]